MEFKDKQIAEPWSVWSSLITLLGSLITKKVFGFNIILISTLVLVLSFSYYAYLDNLYFVDPIYESDALREYSIEEKLTIRVIAPDNFSYLKKFIEKYSLCQAVHEIQVILPVSKRNIKADNFVYAHTHSKMTMEYVEALTASSSLLSTIPFDTEGLILGSSSLDVCNLIVFRYIINGYGRRNVLQGYFFATKRMEIKSSCCCWIDTRAT